MRVVSTVGALLAAGSLLAGQGTTLDQTLQAQLAQLFPAASTFSPKQGDPPHFTAYLATLTGLIPLASE